MELRRRMHLQLKAVALTTTIDSLKVKALFVVGGSANKVLKLKSLLAETTAGTVFYISSETTFRSTWVS